MRELLNQYRQTLRYLPLCQGLQPVKMEPNTITNTITEVQHILWMLDEMEKMNPDEDTSDFVTTVTKFNRWLGFIQGWMWHQRVFSIEALSDQNRKALQG